MEVTSLQIWEGKACSHAVTIQNYSTLLVQGTLAGFLTHMHTQTNTYTRLHTDTQSRMPPTLLDTLLRPHITFQSDWNASSQLGSPSLRVRVWETRWWSDVVLSPCQWEDCVYECVCQKQNVGGRQKPGRESRGCHFVQRGDHFFLSKSFWETQIFKMKFKTSWSERRVINVPNCSLLIINGHISS